MTQPLYYDDPLLCRAEATVSAIEGDATAIILDRTVFYPEGGGQPADRGTINGQAVADVQKRDDGTIVHTLSSPPGPSLQAGSTVELLVDWNHRWEYMQQHTGQHLLSGSLARVAQAPTVSVSQGSNLTTIEVDRDQISDATLQSVIETANEVIRENRGVRGFWIQDHQLAEYRLRRPTNRRGAIRLVEIEDFDLVACGGVHLPATGLLNLVDLVSVERLRGRLRLGFKIGDRARADYRELRTTLQIAADLFSTAPAQVPDRVKSMQQEVQDLHRERRHLAARVGALMLDRLKNDAAAQVMQLKDESEEVFSELLRTAGESPQRRLCVLNQRGSDLHWAFIIGADHPFEDDRYRRELLQPTGARGGGKPPLWRGVIKNADHATAADFAARFTTMWES
jgi:alanyl-tRNA synthetase